ncbi:MAG: PDZ domain-containing protein [Spirochaetes bacterium]|jgi:carboxyl-terminal processing protease|nr:PDZ domain-containing protein [Spirochaetota bacterium]
MKRLLRYFADKERLLWLTVTAGLFVILLVTLVPVSVAAQPSQNSEDQRLLQMFERVYEFVRENYVDEVDPEVLIEGALDGMFDSLDDPHSAYLTAEEMRDLRDTTRGQFGGVGMYIAKQAPDDQEDGTDQAQDEGGFVEVVAPIEDTPAFRSGIHAGDLIVEIEGKTTRDLDIDQVVNRLRGQPGTTVEVLIRRGSSHTFTVELTRAIIEVPTVKFDMIDDDIAFLRIIQFTPYTHERVRQALADFEEQGYASLIIDLRQNPGGLLSGVVDTADLFFTDGTIVGTRGRKASENEVFRADAGRSVPEDLPIVVLIDEGSASAAEIMAGALKDRDRAYVIGETTYGKGSVQEVHVVGTGGFRLTMSKYYTPDGNFIEGSGITPDQEVEEPELSDKELESLTEIRDKQLITGFVDEHPDPGEEAVSSFLEELSSQDIVLSERRVRKMIRDEVNRRDNVSPAYDLKYDIVLQEAVRLLREDKVSVGE